MAKDLMRLWRGEMPLGRAFWSYAVLYGLSLNLLMSGLSLAAYALFGSITLALVLHFAPLPYNVAFSLGVWRSADRYGGPAWLGIAARVVIVLMFIGFLLI